MNNLSFQPHPLLLMVLALTVASPVASQNRPAAEISDSLEVSVFNVDVRVEDRQGTPVTGLTQGDFQVRVGDRKKAKPSFFSEVVGEGDEPLALAVYVDHYNLSRGNRDRAVQELADELEREFASRPIQTTVVTFDGRLEIVHPLSDDTTGAVAALRGLVGAPTNGGRLDALERSAQSSMDEALRQLRGNTRDRRMAMASLDGFFAEMRNYAQGLHDDCAFSLATLSAFVRTLAGVQGRKALVYVSDGLPLRPVAEGMERIQSVVGGNDFRGQQESSDGQGTPQGGGAAGGGGGPLGGGTGADSGIVSRDFTMEMGRFQQAVDPYSMSPIVEGLVAEANTYRVTLYPVKAPPGDASGAELREQARAGGGALSDMRELLVRLAEGTAGTSVTDDQEVTGLLHQVREDVDHYYSLGIDTDGLTEGEAIALQLKVKGKGRVRYRESFIPKSFETRFAERAIGAVLLSAEDNTHGVDFELGEQSELADGLYQVDLKFILPIGQLGLLENNGVHSASSRVVVAALDSGSVVQAVQQGRVQLQIPDEDLATAREQSYLAVIRVNLPAGTMRLGLGFWDEVSQSGSFLNGEIEVGSNS